MGLGEDIMSTNMMIMQIITGMVYLTNDIGVIGFMIRNLSVCGIWVMKFLLILLALWLLMFVICIVFSMALRKHQEHGLKNSDKLRHAQFCPSPHHHSMFLRRTSVYLC